MSFKITTKTLATHELTTIALIKDNKPDMSNQEQILFEKNKKIIPEGWIEILNQYVTITGDYPVNTWLDIRRKPIEDKRIEDLEYAEAEEQEAWADAQSEYELREQKRLMELNKQKEIIP